MGRRPKEDIPGRPEHHNHPTPEHRDTIFVGMFLLVHIRARNFLKTRRRGNCPGPGVPPPKGGGYLWEVHFFSAVRTENRPKNRRNPTSDWVLIQPNRPLPHSQGPKFKKFPENDAAWSGGGGSV